jgi:hypothetical protein
MALFLILSCTSFHFFSNLFYLFFFHMHTFSFYLPPLCPPYFTPICFLFYPLVPSSWNLGMLSIGFLYFSYWNFKWKKMVAPWSTSWPCKHYEINLVFFSFYDFFFFFLWFGMMVKCGTKLGNEKEDRW